MDKYNKKEFKVSSSKFNVKHKYSKGKSLIIPALMVTVAFSVTGNFADTGAQMMGERAEMDRLEVKADEAVANGDPNGAAIAIGRAALMASLLAKQESGRKTKLVYEGAEDLFRTQENVYRALALFDQAGGLPPAPSGVCQLLSLADQYGAHATKKLAQATPGSEKVALGFYHHLKAKTQEWVENVDDLQAGFSCKYSE